jgi:Icc-related predicted phosphoesterase
VESLWAERASGDGRVLSRIAVITDIHANLLALEACLTAIDPLGVDAVLCGGDLVGYGPIRTKSAL